MAQSFEAGPWCGLGFALQVVVGWVSPQGGRHLFSPMSSALASAALEGGSWQRRPDKFKLEVGCVTDPRKGRDGRWPALEAAGPSTGVAGQDGLACAGQESGREQMAPSGLEP